METLSKTAYAKKHGWTPGYVSKLIKQGRLVLDDQQRVLVAESDAKIAETAGGRTDVAQRNAAQRKQKKRGKDVLAELQLPMDALLDGSRAKYKAMAMHFENQLKKLEMAKVKHIRFELSDVRDEAQGIGNTLRAAMERLIDTTAPRMAIAQTQEERARILQVEIAAMRKTMKNAFPRALMRLTRKNDGN